jgi:hypothetical protein
MIVLYAPLLLLPGLQMLRGLADLVLMIVVCVRRHYHLLKTGMLDLKSLSKSDSLVLLSKTASASPHLADPRRTI